MYVSGGVITLHIQEANEWVIFNNIIYQIHQTSDFKRMCQTFLKQMKLLIDYDSAVIYFSSQEDLPELTDYICYHYPEEEAEQFLREYQHHDFSKNMFLNGKGMVFRGSDICADNGRNENHTNEQQEHSVHIFPAYDGKVLAKISLYRSQSKSNFIYDEIFLLEMLRDHLALRIERCYEERARQHNKLSIDECGTQYHLTARETTILGLLMQGLPNEVICTQLVITNNTLKKHILNIYKKLHIRNRTQLFKMVREYAD